ncbi:MAG: hypothetical protein ABII02_03295 [Candidatus Magasanikbacteria bacterium]
MKKKFVIGIIIFLGVMGVVYSVSALDLGSGILGKAGQKAGYDVKATTQTTFSETLGVVIQALLSFIGVIFMALVFYGGYLWMVSRGSEDNITKARKIISSSIIGLIITLAAYSITAFVVPTLLKKTTGDSGAAANKEVACCKRCDSLGNNCEINLGATAQWMCNEWADEIDNKGAIFKMLKASETCK